MTETEKDLHEAPWVKSTYNGPLNQSQNDLRARMNAVKETMVSIFGLEANPTCGIPSVMSHEWAFFEAQVNGSIVLSSDPSPKSDLQITKVSEPAIFDARHSAHGLSTLRSAIIDLTSSQHVHGSVSMYSDKESSKALEDLLDSAISYSQSRYDFQDAYRLWESRQILQQIMKSDRGANTFADMLRSILDDAHTNMKALISASDFLGKQKYSLSGYQNAQLARLQSDTRLRRDLRLKMWYTTDVRNSSIFENTMFVAQALKEMASSSRSKPSGGLASWARQRFRNPTRQDQSINQTIEALSDRNDRNGHTKLNDEQVERTTRWLTRSSIENFCKGEERIHRFCFEIQKCVNKLTGSTLVESPVLWSSRLFRREEITFDARTARSISFSTEQSISNRLNQANGQFSSAIPPAAAADTARYLRSSDPSFQISYSANAPTLQTEIDKREAWGIEPVRKGIQGQGFDSHESHYLSNRFVPFGSTMAMMPYGSASQQHDHTKDVQILKKKSFTEEIRHGLFGLLLSDLGYLSWHLGTETDSWINGSLSDSGLHGSLMTGVTSPSSEQANMNLLAENGHRHPHAALLQLMKSASAVMQDKSSKWEHSFPKQSAVSMDAASASPAKAMFPYRNAYEAILENFALNPNPFVKLRMLSELENVVMKSIEESSVEHRLADSFSGVVYKNSSALSHVGLRSLNIPRTKATSFEEIIANCTERRASTMRLRNPRTRIPSTDVYSADPSFGTDEIVYSLLEIFRDRRLRPPTLFRDLQYIASFVPAEILDHSVQGKAFWDAGLAALALKEDLCDVLIDRATQITTYHISPSDNHNVESSQAKQSMSQALADTTLDDAANLWIIAAKEGSAVAARELALFYLTHPQLLPRVVMPFSKAKDMYGFAGPGERGNGSRELGENEGKLDKDTFSLVVHWMELAANGGVQDAKDFIRNKGEMKWGK